jgi:hypothetical protein
MSFLVWDDKSIMIEPLWIEKEMVFEDLNMLSVSMVKNNSIVWRAQSRRTLSWKLYKTVIEIMLTMFREIFTSVVSMSSSRVLYYWLSTLFQPRVLSIGTWGAFIACRTPSNKTNTFSRNCKQNVKPKRSFILSNWIIRCVREFSKHYRQLLFPSLLSLHLWQSCTSHRVYY